MSTTQQRAKFRDRLSFDQSKVWDWNRTGKVCAVLLVATLLSGCHKQTRTVRMIPPPTGTNQILATRDGKTIEWITVSGGPSGAVDVSSHFGEIEVIPAAMAKYIRSPISYAKEPPPGQLVVFGPPGRDEQSVEGSGMSADVIGIANGVLIPAKLPPTPPPVVPTSFKLRHMEYYPALNLSQSGAAVGHAWALPAKGYATFGAYNSPEGYRSGALIFADGLEAMAYLRTRLHPDWDKSALGIDLLWWSTAGGEDNGDMVSLVLDYSCADAGDPAGANEPVWAPFASVATKAVSANSFAAASASAVPDKCVPGMYFRLRIKRAGTVSDDNFKASFNLEGLTLHYVQAVEF